MPQLRRPIAELKHEDAGKTEGQIQVKFTKIRTTYEEPADDSISAAQVQVQPM
ncbi:hypothetical protein KEM48_010417 [Puccinia striiformis f. sp. tritici PST-130]|nr:hypothetical protein KEM48_010417 [Puccinia striiformis f. sp. tritici PST-130]